MTASRPLPTYAALRLGRTVRQVRKDGGFSQRSLAERVEYTHVMIHRLEAGKWPISRKLVSDVADALVAEGVGGGIEWDSLWEDAHAEAEGEYARREFERQRHRLSERPPRYFPSVLDGESVASFQKALLRLRRSAGNPSYNEMARRSKSSGYPVSRTALNSLVQPGRRELRFETVLMFLEVCKVPGSESDVWMSLYAQLPVNPRRRQGEDQGDLSPDGEASV
ncbi:helix-turn-helix domain-containing protein [Nocardia fluminea]|uniref:helix-turn-helix domain-containing protein n=1 Tax=Nocardia fluminea TaxID=134984 RepID=UPI0036680B07